MFCSKCGTQIQDNANFCFNCGNPVGGNAYQQPNTTQSSDAYQQDDVYEEVNVYQQNATKTVAYCTKEPVKSGVNIVYPDGHSEIGDLYIYETEMVFIKKSKGIYIAFGLPGRALEKGEEKLRFDFSDIVGGMKTRIGINPNVYQITLRSGETYKLCLDKPKVVSYLEGIFR